MRIAVRLVSFARRHGLLLVLAFICLFLSTGFSLVVPWILRQAIDNITGHGPSGFLIWASVGILVASALDGIAAYGNNYYSESASQRMVYDLRNTLYERLQRLSLSFHDKTQTGELMSRATADVEVVRTFVSRGLLGLAYLVFLFFGITILLALLNWRLALLSLAFLPPIGWRAIVFARRLRPIWRKIQDLYGVIGTTLEENLTGVRVVKAFSRQKEESQKLAIQAKELYDTEIGADKQLALSFPMMVFLVSLPTALILWYGGRQIIAGNMTLGGLTQFMFYLGLLALPIRRLGYLSNMLSRSVSAGQRIFEILDAESEVQEKPNAIELGQVKGEVAFANVSFGYNASVPILKNVSFHVSPGQLVALIGGSGSGKSTIANLVPRFYDVSGGSITIDGTDIRNVTLTSLRKNIGIVHQDIFLFSATVRDNIAYGAVDATPEQIIAAAKVAHLDDFIQGLPDGYDTWVGERGVTLSGGEKQRLAIARTILTDPRVLIFDDSTSSIDAETERFIRVALDKLIKGRTTFIITHRLPIIQNADLILVLRDGELVGQGRHRELIASNPLYAQIYQAQTTASENAIRPIGRE
ncbi:MAG: ABC transporter ATP-binding protein [Chloroflexota bacterium]